MSGIIHEVARQCARNHIALAVQLLEEDFIRAGAMSALLIEALDEKDQGEMDAAIDQAMGAIDGLEAALPQTEQWKAIVDALVDKWGESDAWGTVYDETADPKARATAASDLTKIMQDVLGEVSAIVQCVETLKGELGKMKPEDPTKTIGDLAKDSEENDGDFPTMDDISSAIEKSYTIPDWFNSAWTAGSKEAEKESGGFFDKVMGFLKNLFGGDDSGNLVDDDAMLEAVLSSPFEEFAAVNLQSIQQELSGAAEAVGTESTEASSGAAAAQAGQDAAKSGKVDLGAAQKGVEALKSDADTAKDAADAVKGALEPGDFAAFQTALDGKLDALAARQQEMMAKILALYASGPDGADPETVADVAAQAEEAADAEVAGDFKNMKSLADLGDTHFGDGGGELVKTMLSDDEASKLFAGDYSKKGPALHETSLMRLLFEQEEEGIAIEDLVTAFEKAGEATGAPGEDAVIAWANDVNDQELLDKKISVPTEDGEEGEEGAPVSDEEAEEEQETAQAELEAAAQEAASEPEPPAVAVAAALDNWAAGLSDTSQKSLTQKKRLDGLKDLINTALDGAASAIEGEVSKAIDAWRGEHEETLIKSKRFAKKNFDSLSELIPQIASQMLKMTSENNTRLTRGMVHKTVYRYLDRKFGRDKMLIESSRWAHLAGLRS